MTGQQPPDDADEFPFGVTPADEQEKAVLRYQSIHHPESDKGEYEGTVIHVDQSAVYFEDPRGRELEVTESKVILAHNESGRHKDRLIGEEPEMEMRLVHEVYVDGTARKLVRAPDARTAREKAIQATDHGELYDNTDRHAASRAAPDDVSEDDEIIE